MSEEEKKIIEKQMAIIELFPYLLEFPMLVKFFDVESEKLLDEKIEVLEAIKAGKKISEIPKFYDIFELMPKEGIWD